MNGELVAGVDASVKGFKAEIRGRTMLDVAKDVLAIADRGLRARAKPGAGGMLPDERHFLNALHDMVDRGQTAAEELLERYETDWDHDVTRVFAEYSY